MDPNETVSWKTQSLLICLILVSYWYLSIWIKSYLFYSCTFPDKEKVIVSHVLVDPAIINDIEWRQLYAQRRLKIKILGYANDIKLSCSHEKVTL